MRFDYEIRTWTVSFATGRPHQDETAHGPLERTCVGATEVLGARHGNACRPDPSRPKPTQAVSGRGVPHVAGPGHFVAVAVEIEAAT